MAFRTVKRCFTLAHLSRNSLKTARIVNGQQHASFASSNPEDGFVSSKLPPVQIPDTTIEDMVCHRFDNFGECIALECAETGRKYTYAQFSQIRDSISKILQTFPNVKQGDFVAIVLPNVPEYPIIMLGVLKAGLRVTTVNPMYTPEEMSKQLSNCSPKVLFALDLVCDKVKLALDLANLSSSTVVSVKHGSQGLPEGAVSFDELVVKGNQIKGNEQNKELRKGAVLLPYSSGTTGIPKGVEITSHNFLATQVHVEHPEFRFVRTAEGSFQDVLPAILPFFHIFGMIVYCKMITHGCKLVTMPKFTSEFFHQVVETNRPRFLYVVPPMVLLMINNPKFHSVTKDIEYMLCGAAPLGSSDISRLNEVTGDKTKLIQGFGMTETTGVSHHQAILNPVGIKPGGCGISVQNTDAKVISVDDGRTLGPNETGEILVRGPQVTKGYFKNEQANKESFIEGDWFKTGDIGHYDEDLQFYITDRIKELIKVQGFQVAPAELEAIIREHPDVDDTAVIGVPHRKLGEVPKAFVVLKKGKVLNVPSIQNFVASQVVSYKQLLGGVTQLDAIPKNPSGKLLRKVLKTM